MNMESHQSMQMSEKMRVCIANCEECSGVCQETILHCLHMGGEHAQPQHIRIMLDCAEICETSANFMHRMSDLHGSVCGVCAEACERCAQDCARFKNDAMMQHCADVCRRCAETCREMAGAAARAM